MKEIVIEDLMGKQHKFNHVDDLMISKEMITFDGMRHEHGRVVRSKFRFMSSNVLYVAER